jgi:SpoVK/Ycf46/Vps4 family AAA+-type ATPase
MTQSQPGFDAFFDAITTSPEFKKAMTKDWKWDSLDTLEKSLLEMQSWVEKAADIMKWLDDKFDTQLPPTWGVSTTTPPKTGNPGDETKSPPVVEVQHFVRKEWKPWGFEAVAGMDDLKKELMDSFIKPIRFKFLIERIKKADENSEMGVRGEGTVWAIMKTEKQKSEANIERVWLPTDAFDTFGNKSMENGVWKNKEILLRLYTEYEKFKISIPTGMLFYGPPGTGKTFITKKLAEELGCGFISKNMGEFGSSYLHQTTKNIKDFFEWAKKAAEWEPIILFLDEIDSLVSKRTHNVDANKAEEVSQFLQEFNALESAPNLIVIAATNRPDHLDPAILRSGRLDKKIYLGPPDTVARCELFKMYIEKAGRPHSNLNYDELARLTDGYVSADIEAICDEVARDASRDLLELIDEAESGTLTEKHLDGHAITMDDLKQAIIDMPSSLKVVDMSIYKDWLEK